MTFKLTTDTADAKPVMQWDDVRAVLHKLSPEGDTFAVLESNDGKYVQTAALSDGFSIERQDGDLARHFRGKHKGIEQVPLPVVEGVFHAFYEARSLPTNVQWEKMAIKPTSPVVLFLVKLIPWIIAAYLVYLGYQLLRGSYDLWEWLS